MNAWLDLQHVVCLGKRRTLNGLWGVSGGLLRLAASSFSLPSSSNLLQHCYAFESFVGIPFSRFGLGDGSVGARGGEVFAWMGMGTPFSSALSCLRPRESGRSLRGDIEAKTNGFRVTPNRLVS